MRKLTILLLGLLLCGGLLCCACSNQQASNEIGGGTTARLLPNPPAIAPEPEPQAEAEKPAPEQAAKAQAAMAELAVQMLQEAAQPEEKEPKNLLLSPISLTYALGMTANGAAGETLSQLEGAMGLSCAELNQYLAGLLTEAEADAEAPLHLANSIWFREEPEFEIKPDFLQINQDCYNAELFAVPFNQSALGRINGWVNQHTKGMIPQILSEISPDAVMYLINALAFEAEWDEIYEARQIRPAIFTTADGQERQVQMMYGTEYVYLEDEQTTGFIKYYKGQRYALAALLPAEDVELGEYVQSLSGERLQNLLNNACHVKVQTALPQFSCDYSLTLNGMLQKLGVQAAFDPNLADFSGIGNYDGWPLYIDMVLQKCHIEVDAKGTKAAAATVVAINMATSAAPIEEIKYVYLNRPFVYLLIDCQNNNLPLFIGLTADIAE